MRLSVVSAACGHVFSYGLRLASVRAIVVLAATVAALFGFPRFAQACTGTQPHCQPCYAATCNSDRPQWYCDVAAAGTACSDSNACTGPDSCDGAGTCGGPSSVDCSTSNGSGSCTPSTGTCTHSCNTGYQLTDKGSCLAIPAQATITTTPNVTIGGTYNASGPVQAGASYAWSVSSGSIVSGQGTSSITFSGTGLGANTLSLTVTTAAQLTASSSATVNVYAAPNCQITAPTQVTTGIVFTATAAAQAGATFGWSATNGTAAASSTNSVSITPGAAGTPLQITCNVTSGAGATASTSTSVTVDSVPVTTITAASTITLGVSSSASVPNQTSDTYAWSISSNGIITAGATGPSVNFTANSGSSVTLTCLVTNAAGDPGTGTATINVAPPPNATVTALSAVTTGVAFTASVPAQSGTIAWTITNGTASATASSLSTASITLTPTLASGSSGTFTIACQVTNTAGTATSSSQTITVYPLPVATVSSMTSKLTASSAAVSASVPVQAGATYAWTVSGASVSGSAANSTLNYVASSPGTVTLTCVVKNQANASATGSATIAVYAAPVATVTLPSSTTQGTANLTASVPAQSGATFSWGITGGTISAGATSSSVTYTAASAGPVILTATVTNGAGAVATQQGTTQSYVTPNATIAAPGAVTVSASGYQASVPAQTGASYSFIVSGGTGTSSQNVLTFSAGTGSSLTITVTVVNGAGVSATGSATIAVYAGPTSPINAPGTVSNGSTFSASVPAQGSSTYTWSVTTIGATASIASGQGTNAVTVGPVSLTGGGSGTVTLSCTVLNAAGASSTSQVSVAAVPLPSTPVVQVPSPVTSGAGSFTASVNAHLGMTYVWTVPANTVIISAGGTGGFLSNGLNNITFTTTAPAPGSITISCVEMNAASSASTAGSAPLSVVSAPIQPVISAPAAITVGGNGTASVSAHTGMLYQWSISGGAFSGSAGAGGVTAGGTNTVTFTETAATGGYVYLACAEINQAGSTSTVSTQTQTYVVPTPVTPTITAPTPVTTATTSGASVVAHAGMTYAWTISGGTFIGAAAGVTNGSANTIGYAVGAPGTLALTCVESNAAGTTSPTASFTVTVADVAMSPKVAAPAFASHGNLITAWVPARPNMSYMWSLSSATTSAGTASPTPAAGSTSNGVNSVTLTAGSQGAIVVACTETNLAGATASAESSPITIDLPPVVDAPYNPVVPSASDPVGAIPGTAGVEGGAASYHIPIQIPPGRAGMQPGVALTYSSRNGNGVAGVGWSISAVSTIYRCPNIVDIEGRSRPVLHDQNDRLCMDGSRLVLESGSYWAVASQYRTEVDRFDRVTLVTSGAGNLYLSVIQVEHKSGEVSQYQNIDGDTWYLMNEADRQGNCIQYNYSSHQGRLDNAGNSVGIEWLLDTIDYTGVIQTGSGGLNNCSIEAGAAVRRVTFNYANRSDVRTSYRYGKGSIQSQILTSITTSVGGVANRQYQLNNQVASSTTARSLLTGVTLSENLSSDGGTSLVALPPTTFTYQNPALPAGTDGGVGLGLGGHFVDEQIKMPGGGGAYASSDWNVRLADDYDGDGKRDYVFAQKSTGVEQPVLSGCPDVLQSLPPSGATVIFPHLNGGLQDVNADGIADVPVIHSGGALGFYNFGCSGPTQYSTNITVPTNASYAAFQDLAGQGVLQIVVLNSDGSASSFMQGDKHDPYNSWFASPAAGSQPPSSLASYMTAGPPADLNGDGTMDVTYVETSGVHEEAEVSFIPASPGPLAYGTPVNLGDLGGLSIPFSVVALAPKWIDVNGDGLLDIYAPPYLYINLGGPPSSRLFKRVTLTLPTVMPDPLLRGVYAFAFDYDLDGAQELLVPNYRTMDYCGGDANKQISANGDSQPAIFCGDEFDNGYAAPWRSHDHSIFAWDAYRFIESPDGSTYTMVLDAPGVVQLPVNQPIGQGDWKGDGLQHLYYLMANGLVYGASPLAQDKYAAGVPTSLLGPHLVMNERPAPDLLISAQDGLGRVSRWSHNPLTGVQQTDDPFQGHSAPDPFDQCDMHGEKFYAVDARPSPLPPCSTTGTCGYAYFTSSMWAVSRFEQSNGTGTSNRTCYRYKNAMLSEWGRGFQGFQQITEEQQLPPTRDEQGPPVPGCGGSCSANNLKTVTRYLQQFPLTSRPLSETVSVVSGGAVLSKKTHYWHATADQNSAWFVFESASEAVSYDPLGGTLSDVIAVTEPSNASGTALHACSVSVNATTIGGAQVSTAQQVDQTLTDPGTYWWLGRVESRTTTNELLSGFSGASTLPSCATQATGSAAGACSAAAPTCSALVVGTASNVHAHQQGYTYAGDAAPGWSGTSRKVLTETLAVQSNTERKTDYTLNGACTYDTYGNLCGKLVSGRSVTLNPTEGYTYSGGPDPGYFPSQVSKTVSNGARSSTTTITSTVKIDSRTGAALTSQPIQNGPTTFNTYDVFGRLAQRDVQDVNAANIVPTAYSRVHSCGSNPLCAYKTQTIQVGSPTHTQYFDVLGRPLAEGAEGFDPNDGMPGDTGPLEVIGVVAYNARGQKTNESVPVLTAQPAGNWNGSTPTGYGTAHSGFDPLGRATAKTTTRNAATFAQNVGDGSLTTTYNYSVTAAGFTTDIFLPYSAGQGGSCAQGKTSTHCLVMSRTYDRVGHLLQTTETTGTNGAPGPLATVSYEYDSLGNVSSITDPTHVSITAVYDDLGRKRSVSDPDKGFWQYNWDGLGRLNTQTDAKGTTTGFAYDELSRRMSRTIAPLGGAASLESQWQYDYDPGTHSTIPGALISVSGVDGYEKYMQYDNNFRSIREITTIPSSAAWDGRSFAVQYAYDTKYGRIKEMSYPSGEFAAPVYDSRGRQVGETQVNLDGSLGSGPLHVPYRNVTSMSARGAVQAQTLGNGVNEASPFDDSTGLQLSATAATGSAAVVNCANATSGLVRSTSYAYDQFLNLASQSKTWYQAGTACVTESFTNDNLQRLTGESRTYTNVQPSDSLQETYAFDPSGNITVKSDFGTYTYGATNLNGGVAGPHAVISVTGHGTFTYDANGNLKSGDGRTIAYDNFDRPIQITLSGVTTSFRYSPDGERYLQRTTTPSAPGRTTYYVGKLYERIDVDGQTSNSKQRTYIGAVVVEQTDSTPRTVNYLHLDRLGSTDAATDPTGAQLEGHGFDAFGAPRGADWQLSGSKLNGSATNHGFTGHEQLDDTYLTHMNGRVYDYRLGRFLSVDPIIGNPASSQAVNPYSYGGNNPLSGADPTGYFFTGGGTRNSKDDGPGLCGNESGPCDRGLGLGTGFNSNPHRSNGARTHMICGTPYVNNESQSAFGGPMQVAQQPTDSKPDASTDSNQSREAKHPDLHAESLEMLRKPDQQKTLKSQGTMSAALLIPTLTGGPQTAGALVQNTIGFIYGMSNVALGGDIDIYHGAFMIQNAPIQRFFGGPNSGASITLGDWMIFADLGTTVFKGYENQSTAAEHEYQHTIQSRALGPLYLPAHGVSMLRGLLLDGNIHGPHAFMESGPSYARPPQPWPP